MKINIKNTEKLNAELEKVQIRARARLVFAADVQSSIGSIEMKLRRMLHKNDWTGVRFDLDPNAQSFASAYKGVPESTQLTVERFPSGWFVIGICRDTTKGTEIHPRSFDFKAAALISFASNARSWN